MSIKSTKITRNKKPVLLITAPMALSQHKSINVVKFCTIFSLFSYKMLVIWVEFKKMLARIANRADADQTASGLGLCCLSRPVWQTTVFEILEHLPHA